MQRGDGADERFANGKLDGFGLDAGDAYVVTTGGGGGYGDPLERPADDVLADVRNGYVTAAAAYDAYGVVIRDGDTGPELDAERTRREREVRRDPNPVIEGTRQ